MKVLKNKLTASEKDEKAKALELIQYYQKDKAEIEIPEGKLAHFMQIDPRIHGYKQILDTVETGLRVNFEIRLYRETFYLIERAILQRKIDKITGHNSLVQISCVECASRAASVYCPELMDHFCDACWKQLSSSKHNQSLTKV